MLPDSWSSGFGSISLVGKVWHFSLDYSRNRADCIPPTQIAATNAAYLNTTSLPNDLTVSLTVHQQGRDLEGLSPAPSYLQQPPSKQ